MNNFYRVAALIITGATGVALYEFSGGEIAPIPQQAGDHKQAQKGAISRVAISRSGPARIKTDRTLDISKPMPKRPAGLERMIEAKGGSHFPVMVPHALARDEATIKKYNTRLRLSQDGYTCVMTLPDFDVVIYGTHKAFRRPSAMDAEKAAMKRGTRSGIRADYTMAFEDSDDGRGGSLSFGRYGVDYHIEFLCRGDREGCIDEKTAQAFLAATLADASPVRSFDDGASAIRQKGQR